MKDMVSLLRLVAMIEGISLLALLFIAMPLKYYYGMPEVVSVVGMTHGILFIFFCGAAMHVSQKKSWSEKFSFLLIISSMVPFATFAMDRKLKTLS